MLKIVIFLILLIVLSITIPNNVLAQPESDLKYFGKGIVTGENFTNGRIWTGISGDQSTVIAQWDIGRSKIISDIFPSSDCEPNYQICVDATVTSSDNSAAVKVGDKFQIKIDTIDKKQVIVGKFGFLENIMIDVDITKSYEKTTTLSAQEAQSIAVDAYIYGFPLVMMDMTSKIMTNVPNAGAFTSPVNQFAHLDVFPDPNFTAVATASVDTLYSTAFLDLSDEPIVLHVPDTDDRYYLMQIMDAWTNVFDSPGTRTTGALSGDFVITGPFWDGSIPEGTTQIKSPTNLVWILGRTQTNGVSDYDSVHAIQKQYALTPLSSFGKSYLPPKDLSVDSKIDMKTATVNQVAAMDATTFFDRFSLLMQDNPASSADSEALKKFEKIGLVPGKPFNTDKIDSETLDLAVKAAHQKISDEWKIFGTVSNGWQIVTGLGTYGTDYTTRAMISWYAIGANLQEDAMYPKTSIDADGDALNGKNKYVIHFAADKTPPVNAFWSITLYNSEQFFVKNSIDKYAIGDRDNLVFNNDGSLDIYIQNETPQGKESNWLPSPQENFTLVMRMYWPQPEILSGEWTPPAVDLLE